MQKELILDLFQLADGRQSHILQEVIATFLKAIQDYLRRIYVRISLWKLFVVHIFIMCPFDNETNQSDLVLLPQLKASQWLKGDNISHAAPHSG